MISGLILYWAWSWLMMLAVIAEKKRVIASDILGAMLLAWIWGWAFFIAFPIAYIVDLSNRKTVWGKK